ncbi:uncharacterized protein LOC143198459 isoform X2 [Rhynchophorus ferrugineus]|uniref:uncharacterized protein LOC143198459 isoform X2 n=1 Tax=Rhynchophorus ferrugineus TaxID=354439 RepID=UPI003FCCFA69
MSIVNLLFIIFLISEIIAYCEPGVSVNISDGAMIESAGFVIKDAVLYNKHQYYRVNNTLWGCPCLTRKCIRKCCPKSMIMSIELRQCVPSDIIFNVTIYDEMIETSRTLKDFLIVSNSDCPSNHNKAFLGTPFYIQSNGDLFDGNMTFYTPSTYCIDIFDDSLQALICGSSRIGVFIWVVSVLVGISSTK